MKADTPDLIKFKDLQRLLGKPAYAVTGVLEALWIATAKNAFMGDIGRHNNRQIANVLEWDGDADELVAALVEAGWLDEVDGEARLVIHDWYDNAAQYIVQKIHRKLGVTRDTLKEPDGHMHARALWAHAIGLHMQNGAMHSDARPPRARTLPIPSQPNPSPPPPTPAASSTPPSTPVDAEWEAVVVELHAEDVGRKQSCLKAARANGATPADVLGIIRHYRERRPAWDAGALHDRILECIRDDNPQSGWPPPSKAAQQAETSAKREQQAADAKLTRAEGEQRKREAAARLASLEQEHGLAVNRLDRQGMESILDERLRNWRRLYRVPDSGKNSEGGVRYELLCHFAELVTAPAPA